MNKKNRLLKTLYQEATSKTEFQNIFGLNNTRSIENYVLETNKYIKENRKNNNYIEQLINLEKEEIAYDTSIKKYRFNTLLPSFIPYETLLSYLGENIDNFYFIEDFNFMQNFIQNNECILNLELIDTSMLSSLLQKIIQLKLALQMNYSIKIKYQKGNDVETKYINPHTLINSNGIYYLNATYHEKNISDIGEPRTFALSGIISIIAFMRSKDKLFQDVKGNEWGAFENNKFVLLKLKNKAAYFYKREGLAQSNELSFITEEVDGSIQVKMYYANEQAIINFIQKWMPYVTFIKDFEMRDRVLKEIKTNLYELEKNL